nr:immunoglobulin heavy chain junction region [Mus musculus]
CVRPMGYPYYFDYW